MTLSCTIIVYNRGSVRDTGAYTEKKIVGFLSKNIEHSYFVNIHNILLIYRYDGVIIIL